MTLRLAGAALLLALSTPTRAAEFATLRDCINAFSVTPKDEPPEALHYRAVNELVRHGEAAIRPLRWALSSKDKRVRQYGILALGRIRSQRAFRSLLDTLKDPDRDVRAAGAEAFGLLGDPRALGPLTEFLSSEDEIIVRGGIVGLGRLGDNRAVPVLLPLLKSENWEIRWRTALALGHIREMDTWAKLGPLARDKVAVVRGAASWALGAIVGQPDMSEFEKNLGSTDGSTIYGSAWAVGVIGSSDAAKLLQKMVAEGNPTAKEACSLVLRWMGYKPEPAEKDESVANKDGDQLKPMDIEDRWLDRYNRLEVSATEPFDIALPKGVKTPSAATAWLFSSPQGGVLLALAGDHGSALTLKSTDRGRTWVTNAKGFPTRIDAGVAAGGKVHVFDKHAFRRQEDRYVTRHWTSANGGVSFGAPELATFECSEALRTDRMSSPAVDALKKTSAQWSERFFRALTGNVLDLGEGLLLATTEARLEFDVQPRAISFRSKDGGKSWGSMATVMGEGVGSPSLAPCADDHLACLARDAGTGDLLLAWSVDQGKSWWDPIRTGSKGASPMMVGLHGDVLACCYVLDGARIMFDANGTGRRWTDRICLIPDGDEAVTSAAICEVSDGRLLYVYTTTEGSGKAAKPRLKALYVTVRKTQE